MTQEEKERRPQLVVRVPNDKAAEEVLDAQATIEREGDLAPIVDDPAAGRDATPVAETSRTDGEIRVSSRLWKGRRVNAAESLEGLCSERKRHAREPLALCDGLRLLKQLARVAKDRPSALPVEDPARAEDPASSVRGFHQRRRADTAASLIDETHKLAQEIS